MICRELRLKTWVRLRVLSCEPTEAGERPDFSWLQGIYQKFGFLNIASSISSAAAY